MAVHRERLARYEGYAARRPSERYAESVARVLTMGTAYERAGVEFWESVLADPPQPPAAGSP